MCTALLPPGVSPIAVNKYIISHNIKHSNTIENCYSTFTQLNSRLYSSSSNNSNSNSNSSKTNNNNGGGGDSGGSSSSDRSGNNNSGGGGGSDRSGNNNSGGGRFNKFVGISASEAIHTLKQ